MEYYQPKVEFLDRDALIAFVSPMKTQLPTGAGMLQTFIDPKFDLYKKGRCAHGLRVKWLPHLCMVSARVNLIDLNKPDYHIWNKAVTFEGPPTHSEQVDVNYRLAEYLKACATQIAIRFETRLPPIAMMELNFRVDDENRV